MSSRFPAELRTFPFILSTFGFSGQSVRCAAVVRFLESGALGTSTSFFLLFGKEGGRKESSPGLIFAVLVYGSCFCLR